MKLKYWLFGSVLLLLVMGVTASQAVSSSPSVHIDDIAISRDSKTLAVSMWSSAPDPSSFMDITDVRYWVRLYQLDSMRYRDLKIADGVGHIGAVRPGAPNPPKGVIDLRYSNDGSLLATGGRDNTLAVWDVDKRALKYRVAEDLRAWTNNVTTVAFSPDGQYVAAGYGENSGEHLAGMLPNGAVFVYRSADGERVMALPGLKVGVERLFFTRDGTTLIAGGGAWPSTASIVMWDVDARSVKKRFRPGPMDK